MNEKYLLFSLDDDKSKKLGEVISNPSCKRIVNLLAEKELSEGDLARELGMAANTVEYNIRKLVEAGIVEKSKHWWSVKGRKIETYKVANKLIVISPKKTVMSKLKGIVPIVLVSGLLSGFLAWYYRSGSYMPLSKSENMPLPSAVATGAGGNLADAGRSLTEAVIYSNAWQWFLAGSLVAIFAFMIWNWRKL